MSSHSDFILTPTSNILDDVAIVTQSMNLGIDMYPLWDHIMQSLFMKMTGAQEQKMKCLCWEIATVDLKLRRDIYYPWGLNECSQLDDKKKILKHLISAISKLKKGFEIDRALNATKILSDTKYLLKDFYSHLRNMGFGERAYNEYLEIFNSIDHDCLSPLLFFQNCENCRHKKDTNKPYTCSNKKNLVHMYKCLYEHRNRCAHNLTSYQQNRPSLDVLYNTDFVYENYFIRFALLIIIDDIIISLYKIFQKEIEDLKLF